jgi:hypothetical protein
MMSKVASMTLCRSRVPDSRAQRDIPVCEAAPDSDRLIHSAQQRGAPGFQRGGERYFPGMAARIWPRKSSPSPCNSRAICTADFTTIQLMPILSILNWRARKDSNLRPPDS